jgi:transposase
MTLHARAASLSTDDIVVLLERDERLTQRIVDLQAQLDWFQREVFGRKSEKVLHCDLSQQLTLGETLAAAEAPVESEMVVASHTRRRRKPSQRQGDPLLRFDDSVDVLDIVIRDERLDPESYCVVGEKVSLRLLQNPATYRVVRIRRLVIKMKDGSGFSCPPIPAEVFEGSFADVSFLASIVIDKLRYHLPLYRQHQRLLASGITIHRSTMTQYMRRVAELLRPIYQAQMRSILMSRVLAMDETPIRAGLKSKGKMKRGYFWPLYGDQSEIAFHFANSRGHQVVPAVLSDFEGVLLSDGYEAYERFAEANSKVVQAQCWVHTRRHFVKAEPMEPALVREALERIGTLYKLDAQLREKNPSPEQILQFRGQQMRPLVDCFFEWLRVQLDEQLLLPKNPFTKAATYALEREKQLKVFLEDPDVSMDTNHLERQIRPIALGRKNWLFAWTELGAEHLGILQSLVATCRLQDIDPYTYLVDVLQRVGQHRAKDVEELTPRRWKELFADEPLPSLMELVQKKTPAASPT